MQHTCSRTAAVAERQQKAAEKQQHIRKSAISKGGKQFAWVHMGGGAGARRNPWGRSLRFIKANSADMPSAKSNTAHPQQKGDRIEVASRSPPAPINLQASKLLTASDVGGVGKRHVG